MIDLVMASVRGQYIAPVRESDDTISRKDYDAACVKLGTLTTVFVVLPSGRREAADLIRENQETGRVGVAV